MKKRISPALLCLLSVMALVLVCFLVMPSEGAVDEHADHDHAAGEVHTTTATPVKINPDLTPAKSYTYSENKDGTHNYTVKGRSGHTIFAEEKATAKPTFTQVNKDVLMILSKNVAGMDVARFCNIHNERISRVFGNYLAAHDTKVVYWDERTDAHVVFVQDQFDENVYIEGYRLENIEIVNGVTPKITAKVDKNGKMTVTYPVKGGTDTIEIDLTAK